jgi:aryl-alcohol dehydrogenase-like predicted oxidoreductase
VPRMSGLPTSHLGSTGLVVTKLGYGAMELRGPDDGRAQDVLPADADALLNAVLDAGINYIDTSPDYGVSEEHIGRAISHRRDEFFLASKCGCPVEPAHKGSRTHVFTRTNIRAGVEQSLRRMKTDYLDVVQFHHNPSRATLEEHDSVLELDDLRREGKVRFVGVSGTLPNLVEQVAMGVFDVFQIPYSALEREHEEAITAAAGAGAGVVVRGGVARGVPDPEDPRYGRMSADYRATLERRKARLERAELDDLLDGMSTMAFLLRFTLSHPDMATTIVGTANPAHLAANITAARAGPLPREVYEAARERLATGGPERPLGKDS